MEADEGYTHSKTERYMDGGNHPLEDNYTQHYPWRLSLPKKNVTTGPAKRGVYAWYLNEVNT